MSDIDLAVTNCKRLESLLERRFGATGKGLHEKVSSVQDRLPPELVRKLRLVATVRNKIVHESDYKSIEDRDAFVRASREAERELKALGVEGRGIGRWLWVIILLLLLAAAFIAYKAFLHG